MSTWQLPKIFALISGALLFVLPAAAVNRDALRQIVQEQCLVHWVQQHIATPCERIYVPSPPHERQGYAVLADRKGGAHFLLIATKTVSGMESPEAFEPGTPNYFAAAWRARERITDFLGHPLPRDAVGLALNPQDHRTQDQLHIHIECLRADIADTLRVAASRVTQSWTALSVGGSDYRALRIMGEELDGRDPLLLVAEQFPAAKSPAGNYTVLVAGMSFIEGPGFIVLARPGAAGELLLDSACPHA